MTTLYTFQYSGFESLKRNHLFRRIDQKIRKPEDYFLEFMNLIDRWLVKTHPNQNEIVKEWL